MLAAAVDGLLEGAQLLGLDESSALSRIALGRVSNIPLDRAGFGVLVLMDLEEDVWV